MEGQGMAAFRCPRPRRSLTGEGNLLSAKARLVADHRTGAALACQAVTHGDARWLTVDRKVKLPATAGGVSGGKDTQGWRDSSHTAMVGAGKYGSAKLPMATVTVPGKPSFSQ